MKNSKNPRTGKKYADTTIRVYNQCLRVLELYEKHYNTKLKYEDIDLEFYKKFRELMHFELKYKTNTVGKHIGTLKLFLNKAIDRGLTFHRGHLDKRFIKPIETVDSIYLTELELSKMYQLDLTSNPRLERVRDSFIFHATQTALRPIDWHQIKPDDIYQNDRGHTFLRNKSIKTKVEIAVPIYGIGLDILKKYSGITKNSLPPLITDQKANQYIKEVAKMLPELNIEVDFQTNEKNTSDRNSKMKWELVENRTARHSFATNHVKSGKLTTRQIMLMTGHRTEESFLKYLKIATQENAELVNLIYS